MEFAIEERSRISVYLGSSASIVATLYQLATSAASSLSQVFSSYDESTPYIERFAYVADAQALADLANSLGLPLSTRSAHRVLNNEIKPVPLHLEFLSNTKRNIHIQLRQRRKVVLRMNVGLSRVLSLKHLMGFQ